MMAWAKEWDIASGTIIFLCREHKPESLEDNVVRHLFEFPDMFSMAYSLR